MKHHSVIAALAVMVCLWVGSNSAFADGLVWQNDKATAVSMAKSQGKKILLLAGRNNCSVTTGMRDIACESLTPPIKSLIEHSFVPWFIDVNAIPSDVDYYGNYAGFEEYYLPLICVIDPNNSNTYLDRTTNQQEFYLFYSRLLQYAPPQVLSLSPDAGRFDATSARGVVTVTVIPPSSSPSWTAVSNALWITITAGSAGTGNGTVAYSVSANTTGSSRTGTMTIGGQTFTVTQNGPCTYTISPFSSDFSSSPKHTPFGDVGNTGTVAVTTSSSCFWSATSNDSWITITAGSVGTGNGTVAYSVSVNTTESSRTGTMTIGGQTFTVTQTGSATCTYTISPTSSLFSSLGNTGTVSVTTSSSCPWSAASNNPSWITITAGSAGIVNGTVAYSVSANTTESSRTGTMTIGGQTFTVNQSGVSCSYAISSTSNSFSSSAGTGSVGVTATSSCSWTASNNDSWITITAGSVGTGNGTVAYSVSANTTESSRTGTMTIGGQTFTVTQTGSATCAYTISPTSAPLSSSPSHTPFGDVGNTGTVAVAASSSCPWSAASNNPSWITITAGSAGTGNGTVSYSVSANTTGSSRTGTMAIGGQTFTVSQNGSCTYTISPTSAPLSSLGNTGTVAVTTSSSCPWSAASDNPSWITITAGSTGTGNGTVSYSVSANTTGSSRTGTMTIEGQTFTVTQTGPSSNAALYFPHVDTNFPWQTEIAIINTSPNQVIGTLRALSNEGQLIETKAVTLSARGRRQITITDEFTNHADIGYIIFDTDSAAVQGYTKVYIAGYYRAAIPAVKEVNTSDIYISHIASNAQWWTGVSLVNTTSATKELTITFNNGQSVPYTLNANEHKVFTIGDLLNQPLQPDIRSAVITNASDIIGLELFGSKGGAIQMDGILLTDKTVSTIYYPHVAGDEWWTGIVAYNPSELACTITITPYSAEGTTLTLSTRSIAGKGKYIGTVAELGLPAQTAWFKIDSTRPLSGFELFGTANGNQLAAYAEGGGTSAKEGVFAKIEKNGWTGIAFVNTEAGAASVTLTAYNDNGTKVATRVLPVGGHAKVVNYAEDIFFPASISGATYIAYSSDRNVVGFQLNGTSDGMMFDGLPGLGGTN